MSYDFSCKKFSHRKYSIREQKPLTKEEFSKKHQKINKKQTKSVAFFFFV